MAKFKKNITIEDLAGMVKEGFDEMGKSIHGLNKSFEDLKERNEKEHEEIKLKLDRVAYRFEVEELQRRVDLLERKILHRRFISK